MIKDIIPTSKSLFLALLMVSYMLGLDSITNVSLAMTSESLTELETKLAASEQSYSDIVDGAEKHIRWYQNTPQATDTVIIYLHGFSASRQELSPVLETVADQLAANVFFTRLTGHGRTDDAMAEGSVKSWKNDVREAYRFAEQLGNNIILVGTSTGATLAAWAASENFAKNTKASIMISPNFGVQNNSVWLMRWSWGVTLAKWLNGDYYSFEPVSQQHAQFWTERYPLEAVTPMVKLLDEVDDLDKSQITIPHLIVYSPDDKVININKALNTVKEFSSAEVKILPFSESTDHVQHVLAGVACSPESTDSAVALMVDYIGQQLKQ